MKLGYARVSAIDLDGSLQVEVLKIAGCEQVVIERPIGGRWDNPNLRDLMSRLEPHDIFVVPSFETLGRSLNDVLIAIQKITDMGVHFVSIVEELDTQTTEGRKIASIFTSFTQLRKTNISMATREGMEEARKNGHSIGRPAKLDTIQISRIRKLMDMRVMKHADIARMYDVDPAVISRLKKSFQANAAPA